MLCGIVQLQRRPALSVCRASVAGGRPGTERKPLFQWRLFTRRARQKLLEPDDFQGRFWEQRHRVDTQKCSGYFREEGEKGEVLTKEKNGPVPGFQSWEKGSPCLLASARSTRGPSKLSQRGLSGLVWRQSSSPPSPTWLRSYVSQLAFSTTWGTTSPHCQLIKMILSKGYLVIFRPFLLEHIGPLLKTLYLV